MAKEGFAARVAAATLLHGVLFHRKSMAEMIARGDGPLADLSPEEKARAQSLAASTLRYLGRIDVVLGQFLDKSPPLKARNALRLATTELIVDGIAPHAAVDAVVDLVRISKKTTHLTGLANAVARQIAENGAEIWADLEPQELPKWLARPIGKVYGTEVLREIEKAHEVGAQLDLSLKSEADAEKLIEDLPAVRLPNGSLRVSGRYQVSKLPGYAEGQWWVQDAAASIPVKVLGDVSGKSVLDMCAAPGGKTLQLAAAGASVTALDISEFRMRRVRENLGRVGLSAELVIEDALDWETDQKFDAILLDAPCSATGTIRRHPDLPFAKEDVDLAPLFQLQADMFDRALALLKPGGRLVYCVCSLLPREGERQVKDALARHEGLKVVPADIEAMGLNPAWATADGGMRLRPDYWPELGGMDGFYIAALEQG